MPGVGATKDEHALACGIVLEDEGLRTRQVLVEGVLGVQVVVLQDLTHGVVPVFPGKVGLFLIVQRDVVRPLHVVARLDEACTRLQFWCELVDLSLKLDQFGWTWRRANSR